ncbi:hypothetical protein SAMN02910447_01820 [Ruminococcus sp. YE71]|uniref:rolling circle replication-associated protein n=1 Tax=unclassified Ruminococcus TaxID=2608920 RepID=UPI000887F363|nr:MULTISPECIES: hypothetical protein [unclassified Ruminococcus]SDA20959.1 hypothetical protein SAMN02910446_01850 [Ruminococcus sp. YE78]SFW33263.1 hypothetical protein SAMN02910447_01820 [Ruminococcus sp. YE71]
MKHNTKIKTYPDGHEKVTICSVKLFNDESRGADEMPCETVCKPKNMDSCSRYDSVIRAKSKVFDIVAMNGFTHFVTLTIDPKYHRDNSKIVRGILRCFCSNHVQRDNMTYLLIPEYHKDGKAIHFHGFLKGDIEYIYSGTVIIPERSKPVKLDTARRYGVPADKQQTVYNIPAWIYGYSTAVRLVGDTQNVAKYVTKYVTKDCTKIFGNFYFAGGRELVRDVPTTFADVATPHLVKTEKQSYCEPLRCSFKYLDSSDPDNYAELKTLGLLSCD